MSDIHRKRSQTTHSLITSEVGNTSEKNSSSLMKSSTYHTVEKGDSLDRIAKKYNVSVQELKDWNYLVADFIIIGEKLQIKKQATTLPRAKKAMKRTNPIDRLIDQAVSLIGTGYAWGGDSTEGFDASGFIYYIFYRAGFDIERLSVEGYYNRSFYISTPKRGDLVFFTKANSRKLSHIGIYIGEDQFIHASKRGVGMAQLSSTYWERRFDGFKRFYSS